MATANANDLFKAFRDVVGNKEEKVQEVEQSSWEWAESQQEASGDLFSEAFGWIPEGGDFPVQRLPAGPDTPMASHYLFPKEETEIFCQFMERGDKVRLVGPPGTGKTELVRQWCAQTGRQFGRINFNIGMEPEDLLGCMQIVDGETRYVEGDFVRWVREGYTVLLDEINRAPAGFQMVLQNLLERGGKLHLPQKLDGDNLVVPHPDFRLVAADNTKGLGDGMDKYGSAHVQDVSSLNRWEATLELNYLTIEQQKELMHHWADLPEPCVEKLGTLTQLLQAAFQQGELELPFTPRQLQTVCEYAALWHNPVKALKVAYANSLTAEGQLTVSKFVHDTVGFPSEYGRIV